MSDLPVSWISPVVETSAARPSSEWLMARVRTLLRHHFESPMSEAEETMMMADWLDALGDLPQTAIETAVRDVIRSPSRRRPMPGEVRARAEAYVRKPQNAKQRAPFGPMERPMTAAERERCNEMLNDLLKFLGSSPKSMWGDSPGAHIIRMAAEVCGCKPAEIKSPRRDGELIRPRFLAYRAIREHLGWTNAQIGRAIGNRDAGTVSHGIAEADARIAADADWRSAAAEIDRRLSQ